MLDKGRLATVAVTVAIAISAGHVMQFGLSEEASLRQPAPRPPSLRNAGPQHSDVGSALFSSPFLLETEEPGMDGIDARGTAEDPLRGTRPEIEPRLAPAEDMGWAVEPRSTGPASQMSFNCDPVRDPSTRHTPEGTAVQVCSDTSLVALVPHDLLIADGKAKAKGAATVE